MLARGLTRLHIGTAEKPLAEHVDQSGMLERRDRSIEPRMNAGDRRRLDLFQPGQLRQCRQRWRKNRFHALPGRGHDDGVELLRSRRRMYVRDRSIGLLFDVDAIDRCAQPQLDASRRSQSVSRPSYNSPSDTRGINSS